MTQPSSLDRNSFTAAYNLEVQRGMLTVDKGTGGGGTGEDAAVGDDGAVGDDATAGEDVIAGDGPVAGDGAVGDGGLLTFGSECTDGTQCESGVCIQFGQGMWCTITCGGNGDCPEGSQGKKCNPQGYCRP